MSSTMLRSSRNRHSCTYGCCGNSLPNKAYRAREKQAWKKSATSEKGER